MVLVMPLALHSLDSEFLEVLLGAFEKILVPVLAGGQALGSLDN